MEPKAKRELGFGRAIRRYYCIMFRRKYIEESLKKRKGKCGMHGCCGARIVPCIYGYDRKAKKCRLWETKGYDAIPYVCKIGPFDEKDKSDFVKKHCNYYWEE